METSKNKPKRFIGEQQCDRRLLQMIPAELDARGKERAILWEKTKEIAGAKGTSVCKVIATADEEIRVNDILTIIAVTGMLQDVVATQSAQKTTIFEAGGRELNLLSAIWPASKFCADVTGDKDLRGLLDRLNRLASLKCRYFTANGGEGVARYLYSYSYDPKSAQISVVMKSDALNYYANYGWIIDVKHIRKLSSSPARALALFLSQQPGTRFDMKNLAYRISLKHKEEKENRRQLKKALQELVAEKFILDFKVSGKYVDICRNSKN